MIGQPSLLTIIKTAIGGKNTDTSNVLSIQQLRKREQYC